MIVSKKNLIEVLVISAGIVLLALSVRVVQLSGGRIDNYDRISSESSTSAAKPESSLKVSESFYENPGLESQPTADQASPLDAVTAEAYLVGDLETGQVYLEKNKGKVLPVASMSKLITAITAMDVYSLDDEVAISEAEAAVATDTSKISAGEKFKVKELLYAMLLNSSNIAAEALASSTDRVGFLEKMSSYAWEIGMSSTYFGDPSGIDPHDISTASDFFDLAKYLYKYRSDILSLTKTPRVAVSSSTDHLAHDFFSIHPFIADSRFLGGKTGHTTEARDTMLSIFKLENRPIAIIVLRSDNGKRAADTRQLMSAISSLLRSSSPLQDR